MAGVLKTTALASIRQISSAVEGVMRIVPLALEVLAERASELIDITAAVIECVERSKILHGHATVFCCHTTAALVLNENESLLHEDIADFLEALAPSSAKYRHDDFSIRTENLIPDHGLNAHAHLKQMVLGTTQVLPVVDGKLMLGAWQRLFMLEMDRPKKRTLMVQVAGVGA